MIDFLTKLVILITAIVVLVSSVRKSNDKNKSNGNSSSILKYFEPFFAMLGSYGPMLAILLVLFLFRVLMNPTTFMTEIGLIKKDKSTTISSDKFKKYKTQDFFINGDITEYENYNSLYEVAKSISNNNKKDSTLVDFISSCIDTNHIDFALLGALEISNLNKKDEILVKIINKSIDMEDYEIAVISAQNISNSNKKDDKLEQIFKIIRSKKIINSDVSDPLGRVQ